MGPLSALPRAGVCGGGCGVGHLRSEAADSVSALDVLDLFDLAENSLEENGKKDAADMV